MHRNSQRNFNVGSVQKQTTLVTQINIILIFELRKPGFKHTWGVHFLSYSFFKFKICIKEAIKIRHSQNPEAPLADTQSSTKTRFWITSSPILRFSTLLLPWWRDDRSTKLSLPPLLSIIRREFLHLGTAKESTGLLHRTWEINTCEVREVRERTLGWTLRGSTSCRTSVVIA